MTAVAAVELVVKLEAPVVMVVGVTGAGVTVMVVEAGVLSPVALVAVRVTE